MFWILAFALGYFFIGFAGYSVSLREIRGLHDRTEEKLRLEKIAKEILYLWPLYVFSRRRLK